MEKQVNPINPEKFMKLDESKRNRIINAAMKEFRYGYKKASTDAIVKEAGISKGLLFHYFASKEQLYVFLVRYASDLMVSDYYAMLSGGDVDVLAFFWQIALLKKDLTSKHPYLYDFQNGIYAHRADAPEVDATFEREQEALYNDLSKRFDSTLLRDDINHEQAIDIIACALDSLMEDEEGKAIAAGGWEGDSYERFLDSLRGYLDIFRTCFYKEANH